MPDDVPQTARTTPADIYADLRDRICLIDIAPGTILREGDLATHYGVSRTPVREAIQRLAQLDLVESRNGVGTIVTEPEPEAIRQAYEMRLKVAELIGQMSPNPIEPGHLAEMADHIRRARHLTRQFDMHDYFAINHDVHFLIARIIGNAALRQMWDRLYFQTARVWYAAARDMGQPVADDFERELDATHEAMRRGDATAIGYIQRNHIAYAMAHILKRVDDGNAN